MPRKTVNRRKTNTSKKRPQFIGRIGLKRFINKNWLMLLAIIVPVLTTLLVYYLSTATSDIRPIREDAGKGSSLSDPLAYNNERCAYTGVLTQRFKNVSLWSGYIDKVEILPLLPENIAPQFNILFIDRSPFKWGQEKEIEVKFSVTLQPEDCEAIRQNDGLYGTAIFYDNNGRLLNLATDGQPFRLEFRILGHNKLVE